MTIKYGRLGTDIAIRNPSRISQDGDRITFSGFVVCSDAYDMKAMRMFITNLVNDDEPVIPVKSSYDSDLDGFYRVLSAHAEQDVTAENANVVSYTLELQRTTDYATPTVEEILIGGLRENAHSIGTGAPVFVVTDNIQGGIYIDDGVTHTDWSGSRTSADATLRMLTNGSPTAVVRRLASWTPNLANYYDGAPRIEIQYNSQYRLVAGRRIPSGLSAVGWRLSNGMLRITPSSTAGRIDISVYDGSQWDTAKAFKFSTTRTGSVIDRFSSFTILKNRPEECVVRLEMGDNITGTAHDIERHTLDITLKRGTPLAEFYWQTDNAILGTVVRDTAEASTAITGGIRATADDAAGNRFILVTPVAKTNDLVNGGLTINAAATAMAFGIGISPNGGSATTLNATTDLRDQYFSPWSSYLSIVGK